MAGFNSFGSGGVSDPVDDGDELQSLYDLFHAFDLYHLIDPFDLYNLFHPVLRDFHFGLDDSLDFSSTVSSSKTTSSSSSSVQVPQLHRLIPLDRDQRLQLRRDVHDSQQRERRRRRGHASADEPPQPVHAQRLQHISQWRRRAGLWFFGERKHAHAGCHPARHDRHHARTRRPIAAGMFMDMVMLHYQSGTPRMLVAMINIHVKG